MVALIIKDEWKEKVNPWFAHYLAFGLDNYMKRNVEHGKMPTAKMDKLSSYTVPVPPIKIQDAIVEFLDTFTELEAELEGRRRQYEYYRNLLLSFDKRERRFIEIFCQMHGIDFDCDRDLEWTELQQVVVPGKKATLTKGQLINDGIYPVVNSGRGYYGSYNSYNNDEPTITIASRGEYAGWVRFEANPFWAGGLCYPYHISPESNLLIKFLFYFLKNAEQDVMNTIVARGSIPALNKTDIEKYSVPIPPLPVQQLIVDVLDKFSTLTEDITEGLPKELEMHRKQYEYYRNELLKFPRKEEE